MVEEAIHIYSLIVDNSTFTNNWAHDDGGTIHAYHLTMVQTSFYFVNNYASNGKGNKEAMDVWTSDDDDTIYINDENHNIFSQCVFVINHCTDEKGEIYLDLVSSHLILIANICIGSKAYDEGQTVFN